MENNLYYTATIKELSINQEVYLLDTDNYKAEYSEGDIYPMLVTITQLTDYPTIWVKTKGTNKGFKTYEVYPDQIGLKYLDQSDIESLGWKLSDQYDGAWWEWGKLIPDAEEMWHPLGNWKYRLSLDKDMRVHIDGRNPGNGGQTKKFNGTIKTRF